MSLKVWLPLNGTLENKGSACINVVNNNATVDNNGKIGKCYYFNGSNAYIDTGYSTNIGESDFSISVWVKIPEITSGSYFAICTSKTSTAISSGFGIYWNYTQKKFLWSTADGTTSKEIWMADAIDSIVYDKWIHLVMVRNSNDTKIGYFYINGTRYELDSVPTILNISTDTRLRIGSCTNGSYPIKVYVNDFRVYDHALSSAEIHKLSQCLTVHLKLDGAFGGLGYNLVENSRGEFGLNGWVNWSYGSDRSVVETQGKTWLHIKTVDVENGYGGFSRGDDGIKPNTNYTVSATMFASGNTRGVFWFHFNSSEASGNLRQDLTRFDVTTVPTRFSWTVNSGSHDTYTINRFRIMIGFSNNGYSSYTSEDLYITDIKFEEGTKSTAWSPHALDAGIDITKVIDSSGYGYHGVTEGTIPPSFSQGSPRYNQSVYFEDNTSGIVISSMPMNIFNESVTIAFWLYPVGENGQRSVYATSYAGHSFSIEKRADNAIRIWWDGSPDKGASSSKIYDDEWQHLCVVKSSDKEHVYIYINGELTDTLTDSFVDKGFNGTYRLGKDYRTDNTSYIGKMSDFRVYATELSASDIRELYQTGAKIHKSGRMYSCEFVEQGSRELLAGNMLTDGYSNRTTPTTRYANGEIVLTDNCSVGSVYIPINPSGKTYLYDIEVTKEAGNWFLFGMERYDSEKTPRSNQACAYAVANKEDQWNHKRFFGIIDLSTDGVNPCAFVSLRILNDWSNHDNRTATVHKLSLREVTTLQEPKVKNNGDFVVDELIEYNKPSFYKNGIVESKEFIEM